MKDASNTSAPAAADDAKMTKMVPLTEASTEAPTSAEHQAASALLSLEISPPPQQPPPPSIPRPLPGTPRGALDPYNAAHHAKICRFGREAYPAAVTLMAMRRRGDAQAGDGQREMGIVGAAWEAASLGLGRAAPPVGGRAAGTAGAESRVERESRDDRVGGDDSERREEVCLTDEAGQWVTDRLRDEEATETDGESDESKKDATKRFRTDWEGSEEARAVYARHRLWWRPFFEVDDGGICFEGEWNEGWNSDDEGEKKKKGGVAQMQEELLDQRAAMGTEKGKGKRARKPRGGASSTKTCAGPSMPPPPPPRTSRKRKAPPPPDPSPPDSSPPPAPKKRAPRRPSKKEEGEAGPRAEERPTARIILRLRLRPRRVGR